MGRFISLLFSVFLILTLLPVSVVADDDVTIIQQTFDCEINVLNTERHWISPLAKSPAEPETWFKPERLVTHVSVEILSYKMRKYPSDETIHPPFLRYLKQNAKQMLIELSTAEGRTLTPYTKWNGSIPTPLKINGVLTFSRFFKIPGISPDKIHTNLVVTKIVSGTPVKNKR